MKILVIQQKMIGDVLVSSVLCEHLKNHIPLCQVHYLVNDHTVAVVAENPFIDKIVVFKKGYRDSKTEFYRFLKTVSKENYDAVIDIYGKIESNLVTIFSGSKTKIAYPKWYSKILFTHTIPLQPRTAGKTGITMDDRLGLLSPLITEKLDTGIRPKIYLSKTEIGEARIFLKDHEIDVSTPLFMIGILGSGSLKTYPPKYMADVINELVANSSATLLFNYIPSQEKQVAEIYQYCTMATKQRISLKTFAPSLRKFLGVLYHCDAIIGNEGGAINMAKALNVPSFSIYSPWVSKMGWHTYADQKNMAVHLNDYKPNLFHQKTKKEIKARVHELYGAFEPDLFKNELNAFVERVRH